MAGAVARVRRASHLAQAVRCLLDLSSLPQMVSWGVDGRSPPSPGAEVRFLDPILPRIRAAATGGASPPLDSTHPQSRFAEMMIRFDSKIELRNMVMSLLGLRRRERGTRIRRDGDVPVPGVAPQNTNAKILPRMVVGSSYLSCSASDICGSARWISAMSGGASTPTTHLVELTTSGLEVHLQRGESTNAGCQRVVRHTSSRCTMRVL